MNSPIRIQGSFITDDEIQRIINFTVEQQKASYEDTFMNLEKEEPKEQATMDGEIPQTNSEEELYDEIVNFVIQTQKSLSIITTKKI